MSLFSAIKRNSRLALRGSWGKAIAILLIAAGVSAVFAALQNAAIDLFVEPIAIDPKLSVLRYNIDEYFFNSLLQTAPVEIAIISAFTLLSILILGPLRIGVAHWHYQLIQGRSAPIVEIFRFFESGVQYGRAIWLEINLSVRSLLWAIPIFAVPGGIFGVSVYALLYADEFAQPAQSAMASIGILLAAGLMLLASIFYSAILNRYVLAVYLLCEDDSQTAIGVIKQSVAYSKGYRFSFLWFELSFIGWALLCLFLFPALYVHPYFRTATAMYARYIIEKSHAVPPQPTREFVVEPRAGEPSPQNPYDEFRRPAQEENTPVEETDVGEESTIAEVPEPDPDAQSGDGDNTET